MENINQEKQGDKETLKNISTVFISYNQDSGNDVADEIENKLKQIALVFRDKTSLSYWDSIGNFMKSIRKQDFIVFIVTDKYLKSTGCMLEVFEALKDEDWISKCMFVIKDDAKATYDSAKHADYYLFWKERESKLQEAINIISNPVLCKSVVKELEVVRHIQDCLSDFMDAIKDKLNPSLDDAINAIYNRVSQYSCDHEYKYMIEDKMFFKDESLECEISKLDEIDSLKYYNVRSTLEWITDLRKMGDIVSFDLESTLSIDDSKDRLDQYKVFEKALFAMQRVYKYELYIYEFLLSDVGIKMDLSMELGGVVNGFIDSIKELCDFYLDKDDTWNAVEKNNKIFSELYFGIETLKEELLEKMR